MKKLNLQLDSIKEMLSKEQMKKIVGGYDVGGAKKYMCCWTGSAICSACETHTSAATCISGATLTAC